uniref:Uncharacterized protein n=1 Tax=Candidatus Kentrum sp. LPFa TaxID=2126335 RepID=A0A450X8Q7_9GAMM|nr:MAG: hypothetical protein BECKLPF1236B_GA0070989_15032 [Candidatus Kentron sp. LPFa]
MNQRLERLEIARLATQLTIAIMENTYEKKKLASAVHKRPENRTPLDLFDQVADHLQSFMDKESRSDDTTKSNP